MVILLKVSIHLISILVCGKHRLHGTLKTWIYIVYTIYTKDIQRHGKVIHTAILSTLHILKFKLDISYFT